MPPPKKTTRHMDDTKPQTNTTYTAAASGKTKKMSDDGGDMEAVRREAMAAVARAERHARLLGFQNGAMKQQLARRTAIIQKSRRMLLQTCEYSRQMQLRDRSLVGRIACLEREKLALAVENVCLKQRQEQRRQRRQQQQQGQQGKQGRQGRQGRQGAEGVSEA